MRLLERLHRAVVTADATAAIGDIRPHARLTPAEQIDIYSTAYRLRLAAAVESDYPCLHDYLGAEAMTAQVAAYIDAVPPRSYNLDFYPFAFADFVRDKVPAPAAALAELESAISEIFMRPDSPALTPTILIGCDQTELGGRIFHTRPASRLLQLSHDAETYWHNHKQGQKPSEITPGPVYLCVCRHRHDVLRHRLEPGAHAILRELDNGKNFNAAITAMLDRGIMTEIELARHIGAWLPQWLKAGFFRA